MASCTVGLAVFVSVDVLLLRFGSMTPLGGVTVAVFTRLPVRSAAGFTVNSKLVVPDGTSVPDTKLTVFVPAL